MPKFEVGQKVEVVHVDKNYLHPYIGKEGEILEFYNQEPNCYKVAILCEDCNNPIAILTLFENELIEFKQCQ